MAALDGLDDDIDWAALTHAYGSATDVPARLRAFAFWDGEQDDWDEVVEGLFTTIYHQGTVYGSTAVAVPFLIKMVADRRIKRRHWLLVLLGDIARGSSGTETHWILLPQRNAEEVAELTRRVHRERGWVRDCRAAVAEGFDRYVEALRDPAPLVRITAPFPLLACDGRAPEIASALWRTVDEDEDARARASAILGLGILSGPDTAFLARCQRVFDREDDECARVAAAMALAWHAGTDAPPEAVAVVRDASSNWGRIGPQYAWVPWENEAFPPSCLERTGARP